MVLAIGAIPVDFHALEVGRGTRVGSDRYCLGAWDRQRLPLFVAHVCASRNAKNAC